MIASRWMESCFNYSITKILLKITYQGEKRVSILVVLPIMALVCDKPSYVPGRVKLVSTFAHLRYLSIKKMQRYKGCILTEGKTKIRKTAQFAHLKNYMEFSTKTHSLERFRNYVFLYLISYLNLVWKTEREKVLFQMFFTYSNNYVSDTAWELLHLCQRGAGNSNSNVMHMSRWRVLSQKAKVQFRDKTRMSYF